MGRPEPAIVSYGRQFTSEYPEGDFVDALQHAFVDRHAACIVLDSNRRGNRFLAASAAWALDRRWLYVHDVQSDGQCEVTSFQLTDAGRKALGVA